MKKTTRCVVRALWPFATGLVISHAVRDYCDMMFVIGTFDIVVAAMMWYVMPMVDKQDRRGGLTREGKEVRHDC